MLVQSSDISPIRVTAAIERRFSMDLTGKVCLITGGTSGIGAATALALVRKGATVYLGSRSGEIPPALKEQLLAAKGTFASARVDVAQADACAEYVAQAVQQFGRVDVLVNSAGAAVPGSLEDLTEDRWMDAFAVHVHSLFHLARAATPHMTKAGGGAIILIGSAAGLRGCLGALAYGVVKGALPQFARALGRELADRNIRVNCVAPGIVRTPFQDFLTPQQAENNIRNRIPLHREGQPSDVADAITMLIENDFMTGETLVIDGGMTMRIV